MMRTIFLSTLILFSGVLFGQYNCQDSKFSPIAQQNAVPLNYNSRSDTADLIALQLEIDTRDFANQQLHGVARYQIAAKLPFSTLRFDLIGFNVDSVISNGNYLTFSQSGEYLTVSSSVQSGDTVSWVIYYGGATTEDASGWGGIHHDGAYNYNLGVGFAANPHVYGRSLFPCFDNFVEKSILEEMNIITDSSLVGLSNGLLHSVDTLSNEDLVWRWKGSAPLPSYLVSLAVGDYHKQSWMHDGKRFEVYGLAQDTANMAAGFINLNAIYDAFVEEFGPYRFEKVGYALTITGAMEHAGMIHLPRNLANASLQGEDIIAHELAHMWFGNAVTTETAEDMWINEGFAEFCSHFYEEKLFGRSTYENTVRENQQLVLAQARSNDGGHLALSGVNQNQTYGTHTYQKGAMVAHNLREYLGDSLFSYGIKQMIANDLFGNINAQTFKNALESSTGRDLSSFWEDWIYHSGYYGAHVEVAYPQHTNWNNNQRTVHIHHLSAHTGNYHPSQESTPVNVYKHSYNQGYLGKTSLGTAADFPGNNFDSTRYTGSLDLGQGIDYWLSTNDSAESLGTSTSDVFTWSELNGATTLPRTGVKITPAPNNNGLTGKFYVWHHVTKGNYSPDGVTSKGHFYFIGYEGVHNPPLSYATALPFSVTVPLRATSSNDGLDEDLSGLPSSNMTIGHSPTAKWMTGSPMSNVTSQILGNTGIGKLTFQPEHLAHVYFIMNTTNLRSDESLPKELKVFPNPNRGELKIQSQILEGSVKARILNSQGREVWAGSILFSNNEGKLILPMNLAQGQYWLQAQQVECSFTLRH